MYVIKRSAIKSILLTKIIQNILKSTTTLRLILKLVFILFLLVEVSHNIFRMPPYIIYKYNSIHKNFNLKTKQSATY